MVTAVNPKERGGQLMFEDALRKLRDLQRRAEHLDGEHSVSFDELFGDEFMLRNTDFPSIDAMLEASDFKVDNTEDFAAIPDDLWDVFIRKRTRFTSWDEMTNSAVEEWATRQMGLK